MCMFNITDLKIIKIKIFMYYIYKFQHNFKKSKKQNKEYSDDWIILKKKQQLTKLLKI